MLTFPVTAGALRHIFSVALVITGAFAGSQVLAGDPVPLPRLRPANVAPATANVRTAAVNNQLDDYYSPNSSFSREEQFLLANINRYFNSFRLMEGKFIQFGPDGSQSEGVFFLSRPGKIRFHYKPPVKLDIIANGSTVAVKNSRARTQDMYPLSKTPLRYLLSKKIDLTSDQLISTIQVEPDLISLVIIEQSKLVQGALTLIFDRKTYELRQWVVTDAQGLNTSVALYSVATGRKQDQTLFLIAVNPFK
jgi:outer membrane lipoprotein-sorting protein